MMRKRERLEKTIAGEPTDRVPAALWRHFPGDDQRAADLAQSTVDYQRAYDWDFVKITPASSFAVSDYGVQDAWEGSLEGTRVYKKRVIERSLDWTNLRPLDPGRGTLSRQIETVQLVCEAVGEDTPVIQTLFSPLTQAKHIAGHERLIHDLRTEPDRVHSGLSVLTETTLRFIEALKRLPISGIFYAIQYANYAALAESEYIAFGLPYDQKILETLPTRWWLNVLHLHGESPMFKFAPQLPAQVVNWHDQTTPPTLTMGKTMFDGAVCGGIAQWEHLHQGTPTSVKQAVRDAIAETNGRRLVISTGCVAMITSPLSNIRAVREAVEGA
ncbi:MAG: uroporphyrinogen decarboxylase [Anaerolineae bacterium]|nr:uroporphyrinogen decarboxylase [Anaerolineae bacterium]NUQ02332.1 uroporphyrinogen decarboxylase [Anaerolineae bacterium]